VSGSFSQFFIPTFIDEFGKVSEMELVEFHPFQGRQSSLDAGPRKIIKEVKGDREDGLIRTTDELN
jgi:hypothetical protein